MKSASPDWMSRAASPMQCVLVVHAVTTREVRPRQAVLDRDVTGDHVDDGARHEERRDLARPAFEPLRVIRFDRADAADAGAHRHAVAVRVRLLDLEARSPCIACIDAAMP